MPSGFMKKIITIILLLFALNNIQEQTDTAFKTLSIGLTAKIHFTYLNENKNRNGIDYKSGYLLNCQRLVWRKQF